MNRHAWKTGHSGVALGRRKRNSSILEIRNLHSTTEGISLSRSGSRTISRPTHDYSNIQGWNFNGKQTGC